jgi:uncharacterized protein YbjT (DUF2867 family)
MDNKKIILVTGATGYIASRLIPKLLERGYRVRCLVRQELRLQARTWFPYVEVVRGDVTDFSTLVPAMEGVHTAYYLVHNMASGEGYTARELRAAQNFASAAQGAGIKHIIYLGGLADPKENIPAHMRSRIQTGHELRNGQVPVTEFRAGVIVGPGSISFEMIRFMTELMPVIIGPVWLKNMSQPIASKNVIDYLMAALENRSGQGYVFEIGGPDVMSYEELMLSYGRLRGLWRKSILLRGVPLEFMALGVALMTPVPANIARPLVDGLGSHSLVKDGTARQIFPDIDLIGYEDSVIHALEQLHPGQLEPAWTDCEQPPRFMKHEGFFIEHRCEQVKAKPENVFRVLTRMGGKNGWPYANWLWQLRGWLDALIGGPGLRGGSGNMQPGEAVDFYRVETLEPDHILRLRSELKAPGDGWMEWRVEEDEGKTRLSQTGFFAPYGLFGFVYWYGLGLFHQLVFRGLIKAIARKSEG